MIRVCPKPGIICVPDSPPSPIFNEKIHPALESLARLNPYHLKHCWKLSDALAAQLLYIHLVLRKKMMMYLGSNVCWFYFNIK